MRHVDGAIRRSGDAGNLVCLVYALDGPPVGLREALDDAVAQFPILVSDCPSWPRLRWRPRPGGSIPLIELDPTDDLGALVAEIRERPMPRTGQGPIEVYVAGSVVVLRFLHVFADGAGMHRFARWLSGEREVGPVTEPYAVRRRRDGRGRSLLLRFLAMHAVAVVSTLVRFHPLRPRIGADRSDPGDVLVHRFDQARSDALLQRAREAGAQGGGTPVLAGLSAAAMARVVGVGGGQQFFVPVPSSTRSAEDPGPWVGNAVSGMQLTLPSGRLGSASGAIDAALRAWRGASRRLEHVVSADLLTLAAWLPPPLFELLLRGPALHVPETLLSSYARLEPGPDGTMFGRRCERTSLVGSVGRKPGMGTLWTRSGGRLEVAITTRGNRLAEPLRDAVIALADEVVAQSPKNAS